MTKRGATHEMFEWLKEHRNDIETFLQGNEVSWEPEEKNKACRVAVRWDIDLKNESTHPAIVVDMVERVARFHKVALPLVRDGLAHLGLSKL